MILRKLIGHCCEQEMVDAANAELDALLALRGENERLRAVAEAARGVCNYFSGDYVVRLHPLNDALEALDLVTPQATDVSNEAKEK